MDGRVQARMGIVQQTFAIIGNHHEERLSNIETIMNLQQ